MSRKRTMLTLGDKLRIIEEADRREGATKVSIARDLKIPESSLKTILANRKAILQNASKFGLERRAAKDGKHDALEDILVKWLRQAPASGIRVDGAVLKEKANAVAQSLGIQDFGASNGWLDRFKKRKGIVYSHTWRESASVDPFTAEEWILSLPHLIAEYKPCDVFSAHETGIFYGLQPEQTLTFKGESYHDGERSKERVTVLFCANEDGTQKIPALVIGKFEKPRCLKNLKRLPCTYKFNRKALMTPSIFSTFLQQLDSEVGASRRKILLFLNRAPCHPTDNSGLRNIEVVFLPSNSTSQQQPLDAGVIKCVKQCYRKFLVERRLVAIECGEPDKKFSVLDAMHYIASSWDSISKETIANSFKRCGFRRDGASPTDDTAAATTDRRIATNEDEWFGALQLPIAFADYVSVDDYVPVCSTASLEDIIEESVGNADSTGISDDDEDEDVAEADLLVPTYAEVLASLDSIRHFVCAHDTFGDLLPEVAALERKFMTWNQRCAQGKLTDFF